MNKLNKLTLKQILEEHKGRPFMKVKHYIEVYERYLERFRDKGINMLEIGVYYGGSVQCWKKYFGDQSKIFGLDINPKCKEFDEDGIRIIIGDQEDISFLENLSNDLPKLDVILDDGGHTMKQQINSFKVLYDKLAYGGVYIVEDCNTNYMEDYGGGLLREGTFIEEMKKHIDSLNAWYLLGDEVSDVGKSTFSIHFYCGMVIFEKRQGVTPEWYCGGSNVQKMLNSE